MLKEYTDQQSRYANAFSGGGTLTVTDCEACGRTYFVTSPGHGDYNEGELDALYRREFEDPDKVIEVPDFDSVSTVVVDRKNVVVGCLCDPTKRHSDWIEFHARELTSYLRSYWASKKDEASAAKQESEEHLSALCANPVTSETEVQDA